MSEQLDLLLDTAIGRQPRYMNVRELYVRTDQDLLREISEDRRFERKSNRIQAKDLADYFSMFANTPPDGGIVCVGMDKGGEFIGCSKLSQNQLNALEKTGIDYCPQARSESKRIPIRNSSGETDFLLLFHISYDENSVVETVRGEAFIRIGDSKHKLLDEEKMELRYSKGEISIELNPCNLSYPAEFDMTAILDYCRAFIEFRGLRATTSREQILELSHLGKIATGGFEANLACALLFAKDPLCIVPGAYIRCLRFEGDKEGVGERFNAIKDERIEGQISRQIERANSFIRSQARDFTRLGKDGKFFTAPEYPETAWYEAVVNACVHRSYNLKNMPVFIKMFDDRLVVESPGGFPPLVTPQNIYDMHQPRNPHLMTAMFYLKFVKCAHEGTRRMRETMQELNLPNPEFIQQEVGGALVRVILRNDISHRKVFVNSHAARIVGERLLGTLNSDEKQIVNYLAEYDKISVSAAQRLTGMTWPAANKLLVKLADRGILEHTKRKRLKRDPKARFVLRIPKTQTPSRKSDK